MEFADEEIAGWRKERSEPRMPLGRVPEGTYEAMSQEEYCRIASPRFRGSQDMTNYSV
ncbi:MAG: hypothetical protein WBL18_10565 [Methanothrix sp.]